MNNGLRLRIKRVARGWTQADLAGLAGCTAIEIDRLERGMEVEKWIVTKLNRIFKTEN